MAAKHFTLVDTRSDPDDLEMNDAQYVASLERAVDDLADAHGKLTHLLGQARRELKQERDRRIALEIRLLEA